MTGRFRRESPHLAETYEFINFAMRPEQQKIYTEKMAYGPSNKIAAGLLDKSLAGDLPTAPENMKNALKIDVDFWLEYGENLEERFIAWSSKLAWQPPTARRNPARRAFPSDLLFLEISRHPGKQHFIQHWNKPQRHQRSQRKPAHDRNRHAFP